MHNQCGGTVNGLLGNGTHEVSIHTCGHRGGLSSGVKYLLIEQDNQYGRDPFDCLGTSRDNLTALGYGNLF